MKGADLLKVLFALVVVWIHTGNSTLGGLTRWAVPIFFVLSGFFLFGKVFVASSDSSSVVAVWWKKTLRLYLTWTLIFLPFAIYGFWLDGLPLWKGTLAWLRNVVFRGENYLSWQLWYLLGLLQAGAIIWIFAKMKIPFWSLCILAVFLWSLPRLVDLNNVPIWSKLMRTAGNGFTFGLPFMVLGGLLRKAFPSITGWPKESPFYRPALTLRFFSIHIYLTHMLWAGLIFIFTSMPRGVLMWSVVIGVALATGVVIHMMPSLEKVLYGRSYSF